jgi:rubredoxin
MGERKCAFEGCNSLEFRTSGFCLRHKDGKTEEKSTQVPLAAPIKKKKGSSEFKTRFPNHWVSILIVILIPLCVTILEPVTDGACCLPLILVIPFMILNPRKFSKQEIQCPECSTNQSKEDFLKRMKRKLVGTTETTKTIASARPVVGATIGRGGPGLALGGYKSTSTVPIRLGRFHAMGICPECGYKRKCTFETEVQIWVDSEGNETTEIVGEIQIPKFGIV